MYESPQGVKYSGIVNGNLGLPCSIRGLALREDRAHSCNLKALSLFSAITR